MTKSRRPFKDAGKLFSDAEKFDAESVPEAADGKRKEEEAKKEANKAKHVAHHDLSGFPGRETDKRSYRLRNEK